MTLALWKRKMKSHRNIYDEIISLKNLILAEKKARKGKTKKGYVKKFEENIAYNLKVLHDELKNETYMPRPLKSFILRDPKTRQISKSIFRDRIVHHAICNVIEPIYEKIFIYDSCANRKGKGTFFAIHRFGKFQRKVTDNFSKEAYCLKADIKHYFREVDRIILIDILERTIKCKKTINLIKLILNNFDGELGMPLGNLTSQFFANVYLNDLDYFVKHNLGARFYIRYVDDFVILHKSKKQLELWKEEIEIFLKNKLKIELHPDKSKIIPLSKGIDFLGFKIFYYFKTARKRNVKSFKKNLNNLEEAYLLGNLTEEKFSAKIEGWLAHIVWGNTYNLRSNLAGEIKKALNRGVKEKLRKYSSLFLLNKFLLKMSLVCPPHRYIQSTSFGC